ncbi:MAG: sugar phosphate isomerase/epimerase family protein [Kiritimatiellia bacterium]|nr:TIM barrel protein [Lentisphaerota bacterium]
MQVNEIRLTGQAITSTNYTTKKMFKFTPPYVKAMAERFLACGVNEVEIPQGVLDPEKKFPEQGVDLETLKETLAALPVETKVIGSYLGGQGVGKDNAGYLKKQQQALSLLVEYFPDMSYVALHPAGRDFGDRDNICRIVETFAKLAEHAGGLRGDFQLCFHNHYDSSGETAEQVSTYLAEIEKVNSPHLRWGPDTGHCHGMGDRYMEVLEKYAHLIGDFFHIKARVPAFDSLHGGDQYEPDRDIWRNPAEVGRGLYSGFVNAADPEIQTPFKEIFKIIAEKARPVSGIVRGAMEIDVPRQHPQLEILCEVLYMKNVHGIEGGLKLSNDEIIRRAFGVSS